VAPGPVGGGRVARGHWSGIEVADIGPDGPRRRCLCRVSAARQWRGRLRARQQLTPTQCLGSSSLDCLQSVPALTQIPGAMRVAAWPRASRGSTLPPMTADERSAPFALTAGCVVQRSDWLLFRSNSRGGQAFGSGGRSAGSTGRELATRGACKNLQPPCPSLVCAAG
jgi:hypothetical protein